MVKIFIGFDERQPVAYHVLCHSIMRRSSVPVSFTPLILDQLPIERRGLTDFTFARYLVPHLCGYEGRGIFLDSDMLVLGDVADLTTEDPVSVVPFEGDFTFERPSVMVFDNERCRNLSPDYIETGTPQSLEWAESVGHLDRDWNFLVGYEEPRDTVKLIHYTQGVPGYKECRNCDYSSEWFAEREHMLDTVSWLEIMGRSVHAEPVLQRLSH